MAVAEAAAPVRHELRKTVTVVFADLVDSMRLQERLDSESVRRVMARFYDAARGAVEAHEGRVVKFTGDGVMAVFGTPVVREDDALRAVRAAAALVERLEGLNDELRRDWGVRLDVRTGVNTGEVVVDREDGDVVGDPINVAARLQQAAGVGEVLVGEETRRLVRHDVGLEPVAPLELKGKGEPVAAFRLVAAQPAPEDEARIEAPLVGRDAELARLRAVFDGAVAAKACRLVAVVGSPGIGKTRLARELARTVEGDAALLEGRCEPSDEGITFAPVAEVLRAAAAIDEADPPEAAREKLARLLPDVADRELVVERALGVLGATRAASTEETFWSVRRVLEALARERPLVVVLDDLQWGQPTFLDLVEHLVEWAREVPLLLVVLARPELRELREALVSGRRASDVIELDPLGPGESRVLVDELLGRAAPEGLAERVLQATEGNPLFVGETVRMLVDDGVLRREGDTWVAADESVEVELPPTIHALIAARLERLGEEERAVVTRAAVIGKQFYRGAVAELCPPAIRQRIDGHLETLRRKELVEPEGTYWVNEPVFRFHHVLIRDAAYRSVLKEARAQLHERFADWLEAKAGALVGEHEEVVAFHLEQAHGYRGELGPLDERGRALGERAAERLASAGRRALAREDLPAAANLLGRALDRLGEDAPARPGLLVDLAEALLSAGDTHAAASAVEELHAAAGEEPRLRALAAVYTGQLAFLTDSSRLRETVDVAAVAAEQLAGLGDQAGAAKARHVEAGAFARLGQVAAAEAALDRALAAARGAGDVRRISAVLAGAPLAALWGPSPVVRASGRCLDVVRILRMTPGNRHLEAAALSCQAVLEAMRGRTDAARAMLDGCRATLEELGLGFELLETEVHAGIVELLDGDPAAAEVPLRSVYAGFEALGAGAETERAAALLARTLLDQGRDGEADELTRISEERGGEDLKATIAWCGVRAEALARRGEHRAAGELARRGATMAQATDALTDHADARMALAAVLRHAGRDAEASAEAKHALELYETKENEAGARRAATFVGVEPAAGAAGEPVAPAGPTPPAVWERWSARWTAAHNAHDTGAIAGLMTDDVTFINHRRVATWDQARGAAAWVELQEAFWATSPDARYSEQEFVGGDDLVAVSRWQVDGHMEAGGGEWTVTFLGAGCLCGDRLERAELFDEDDEAGARACAERLRGEATGESANARLTRRYTDALNAHDWEAAEACLTDDLHALDHRVASPLGRERDRQTYAAQIRALAEQAGDVGLDYELIADLDQVAVARGAWRGHLNDGGGEFETPMIILARRRGDRFDRIEVFDPDDDAAWVARFAELLGERGATLVVGASVLAHYRARDWDALGALYSNDVAYIDRHRLGVGAIHGSGPYVDYIRSFIELAPDARMHALRMLDASAQVTLGRLDIRGHSGDGGEFEVPLLLLTRVRGGLVDRVERFDLDEEEQARRRFEELAGVEEFSPNVRLYRRLVDALNARDWDAAEACLTDDVSLVNHAWLSSARGVERDWPTWRAQFRALVESASDAQGTFEVVADLDEVISMRYCLRGHLNDGGGEFEAPVDIVARRRGDRFDHFAQFEPDDAAASACFAELLGERGAALAVAARWTEHQSARNWDALRALLANDATFLDRRQVGAGEVHGPARIMEFVRGLVALAPDARVHPVRLLDATKELFLSRFDMRGHAVDGGEIEVPHLSLGRVRHGLVEYAELFDPGDEPQARRRFEELSRVDTPAGHRELLDRFVASYNGRDWDGMRDIYAPALRILDRRLVGWGALDGRDALVDFARGGTDLAPDLRVEIELLALGRRAGVHRQLARGHLEEGGGELEIEMVVLTLSQDGQGTHIELFDAAADDAALARFEEIGAQTDPERLTARVVRLVNARDWDRLAGCFAEDFELIDHRPLGWQASRGPEGVVQFWRSWLEMVPDAQLRMETLAGDEQHIAARLAAYGRAVAAAGGGFMEYVGIAVSTIRGGRSARTEYFDTDEQEAALARLAELMRGGVP